MQRLLQEVWEPAVYLAVVILQWMKLIRSSHLQARNTMKEIIYLLMVQQATYMMDRFLRLMPRLQESLEELWSGLISIES